MRGFDFTKLIGNYKPKIADNVFSYITKFGPGIALTLCGILQYLKSTQPNAMTCTLSAYEKRFSFDTIAKFCYASKTWTSAKPVTHSDGTEIYFDKELNYISLR